ncbi:MAG: FAD-binding oxidoreductase [Candidatus Obscuribacterales bacterium]|nr:FAD-binding oxidoreductase [Candidatus Obscuribacterales bacterium]
MTISIWQDELNKPREKYDVVIVGSGIMGAGCAYWLSKRGLRVCIVESQHMASGASGRNAGFLLRGIHSYYNEAVKQYGRDTASMLFRFTEENVRLIGELAKRISQDFNYEPSGSYLLACSLEELHDLEESHQLMVEDGFDVEYLKQDPLDRSYYGALYNACDGGVNPVKLVKALIAESGVQLYDEEAVMSIRQDKQLQVMTANRIIDCDKVLLATNAYSQLLEPWFKDRVQPIKGQILVTQPLRKRILEKVCYANYGWEYFRQLPDNRFLLGGCRQCFQDTEVGYADCTSPQVQDSLESYIKDRFPEAAGVPIDYRWSGIMAFTEDGLPLVGELERLPNVYFAVGCNGHGFSYGLNLSKLLVEVAVAGKDAGIFSSRRLFQIAN